MIYELDKRDYEKVRSIFHPLQDVLAIIAVIEKRTRGKIWVDDVNSPKSAYIWNKSHFHYIAGDENNNEYNASLEKLLADKIPKEAKKHKTDTFCIYSSPNWENMIVDILERNYFREEYQRILRKKIVRLTDFHLLYLFKQRKIVDWQEQIPSGFTVERINEDILSQTDLRNNDTINRWIKALWASVDDFLAQGVGCCIIHGKKIVSWCITDYVSGNRCELSLETDKEYRKQGFATLTAAATVDSCLAKKLTEISWRSNEYNLGSRKIAEKIGFEKIREQPVFFGCYDPYENLMKRIYRSSLYFKDFKESALCYEEAFKLGEPTNIHYYDTASAWALAGDIDAALRNLHKAIETGWVELDYMLEDEDLTSLHGTKEWKKVIADLKKREDVK